jgi:hypothetical protein
METIYWARIELRYGEISPSADLGIKVETAAPPSHAACRRQQWHAIGSAIHIDADQNFIFLGFRLQLTLLKSVFHAIKEA